MAKAVAVCSSDWHLDTHAWANRPSLCGDSLAALREIVQLALDLNCPLIAAGDLLERRQNLPLPVQELREQLDRMEAAGLPVLYIQGQHEYASPPWLSAVHPHPIHLPSAEEPIRLADGRRVVGEDWTPAADLPGVLTEWPEDADIGVLHQVCDAWMGGITVAELGWDQVPHVSQLVVGDLHKRKLEQAVGKQGQPMTVLSCGSTNLREISEERVKFAAILYDDGSIEWHELASRMVIASPDLLVEQMLVDWLADELPPLLQQCKESEALPEDLREPIVYVRVHQDLPGAAKRVQQAMGGYGHLFVKVLKATPADSDGVESEVAGEQPTLLSVLPTVVSATDDPELFAVANQLLSSDEPALVLASLREKRLAGESIGGDVDLLADAEDEVKESEDVGD